VGKYGLDSSDSGYGPVLGTYEHDDEPSGSLKGGEFLEHLNGYQLIKKNS
jgi:hypothetical protein